MELQWELESSALGVVSGLALSLPCLSLVRVQEFRHMVEPIVDIRCLHCRSQNFLGCWRKGVFGRSRGWEKAFGERGFAEDETDQIRLGSASREITGLQFEER